MRKRLPFGLLIVCTLVVPPLLLGCGERGEERANPDDGGPKVIACEGAGEPVYGEEGR
jgi:hypothetical protein